jgi:hypothetical protein
VIKTNNIDYVTSNVSEDRYTAYIILLLSFVFFLVDNNDTGTCSVYENKNPFEQCVTQKNNNNNIYRSRSPRALKNSLFFSSSSSCCFYGACSVDAKLASDENNAKPRRQSIFIIYIAAIDNNKI